MRFGTVRRIVAARWQQILGLASVKRMGRIDPKRAAVVALIPLAFVIVSCGRNPNPEALALEPTVIADVSVPGSSTPDTAQDVDQGDPPFPRSGNCGPTIVTDPEALTTTISPGSTNVHDSMDMDHSVGATALLDEPTQAALDHQLDAARAFTTLVPTAAAAQRLGYTLTTPVEDGSGSHWMKSTLVTCTFDPAKPSQLLYDGNDADSHLIALSYFVVSQSEPPAGFAGEEDQWHQHLGLCIVDEAMAPAAACQSGHGTLYDGSDLWMLHAWVVPEWSNPQGIFHTTNDRAVFG